MSSNEKQTFLTAEWNHAGMLDSELEPSVLLPFVHCGTELDSWHGSHFVSMEEFSLFKTRAFGIPIPSQGDFEMAHSRFHVRHKAKDGQHTLKPTACSGTPP